MTLKLTYHFYIFIFRLKDLEALDSEAVPDVVAPAPEKNNEPNREELASGK